MTGAVLHLVATILWFCPVLAPTSAQVSEAITRLNYQAISNFFQMPPDKHFVEPAGLR